MFNIIVLLIKSWVIVFIIDVLFSDIFVIIILKLFYVLFLKFLLVEVLELFAWCFLFVYFGHSLSVS